MKKIMILGAGIYQVPLILEAKRKGYYTIVVSYQGHYPGFALADKCCYLDTTDEEAVLEAAKEEQIDGICTTGTDVAMHTVGYVCRRLGLSGLPYEASLVVTDKFRMKEAFAKGGVSSARFYKTYSLSEAQQYFAQMQAGGADAAMVKAVDSSGSRGITKVTNVVELEHAYLEAQRVTHQPYILLEEFVEGHEIGVDGFISNGEITLMLPHEKFVFRTGGTTIPAGHGFPLQCDPELYAEVCRQMELAVRATGLDNCAFNADVLVRGRQAWILEIGGRAGATGIPELVSIYSGFSFYEKILENAMGHVPDFTVKDQTPCMSGLLFSPVNGLVTEVDETGLEELRAQGIRVSLDYEVGEGVPKVQNGSDRIGQFIVQGDFPEDPAEIRSRIYEKILVSGRTLCELWDKL